MPAVHDARDTHFVIDWDTNKVFPQLLESVVESRLIVFAFAFTKTDEAVSIADVDQDSARLHAIERCYVGHWIWINKNEGELVGVEDFPSAKLEVAFRPYGCGFVFENEILIGLALVKLINCVIFSNLRVGLDVVKIFDLFPPLELF